jgi:hypothetical protein
MTAMVLPTAWLVAAISSTTALAALVALALLALRRARRRRQSRQVSTANLAAVRERIRVLIEGGPPEKPPGDRPKDEDRPARA